MKKILTIVVVILCALSVRCQSTENYTHSGIFADVSAGLFNDSYGNDFGIGLKAGYRYHIYEGICWDVASIGANTCIGWHGEEFNLRFLSGIHYDLPKNILTKSLYANLDLGYCLSTYDTSCGGFAYDIGLGINLTRLISLGLVWEGSLWRQEYTIADGLRLKFKENFGTIGIQFGLNF